jgi:cyclopropane fatty-acyl-phospholipid synthase-like methyltransferase
MKISNKPYSESCDQNREPILAVIGPILRGRSDLLEIGSGTGQHAVFFAGHLPQTRWQTSDRAESLAAIHMWLDDSNPGNVLEPLELDVCQGHWPRQTYDAIFTANTLHIMGDDEMQCFFTGLARVVGPGADILIYGPFNYQGQYTSDSNQQFDQWLKSRDRRSGIKNFEDVCALAEEVAISLVHDYAMPANNRLLHLRCNTRIDALS